jgi:hypothetical protein
MKLVRAATLSILNAATSSVMIASVIMASITLSADAAELTGFALMPANTFAVGPTSGQFAGSGAGGNSLPLIDKQPVQGFSGVLHGPVPGTYYVMSDNGFGTKPNSADTLLRLYAVHPHFKTWNGGRVIGTGTVNPTNFHSGRRLAAFSEASFISLHDPDHKLGFSLVADQLLYPNNIGATIAVDTSIQTQRLLTGADLDIESIRRDRKGTLWFGEEFGPFLVQTNMHGKVLRAEVRTPNIAPTGSTASGDEVRSPQNPYLGTQTPNLGGSRGFEGMAINPTGNKLYTLLEGTVVGDDAINSTVGKNLRINEFDIKSARYTDKNWVYVLEAAGTNIGDMTAINDHQFLVIERNGATATNGTPFKKIFLADIKGIANGGIVKKTELVDLMNIDDPHDLNGDSYTQFSFPFVTIENVLILDRKTLLVINDNNYPGTGGRDLNSDNTEFLKIHLDQALDVLDCDEGRGFGRERD